jgi:hypothetical protein
MMTDTMQDDLAALLALHAAKLAEFTEAEATHGKAQAALKKAQSERYAARRAYQEARRNYIQDCLEKYQKVLCAYCKQLRRLDRMHSSREFGFYWDSDCRYNQWRTPYDRRFAICERCVPTQSYSTREEDGYAVGKELVDFDHEAYMRWLTYGDENLEIAAKALDISFPPLT